MQWRRYLCWYLLGAAVLLLLIYSLRPSAIVVDAVQVRRGPLTVSISEEGITRVIDRFEIFAPVAGYLQRIELEAGDPVTDDQVLTRLEPLRAEVLDPRRQAEAKAQVAAARASLLAARERAEAALAEAEYARSEYQRLQKLSESQVISEQALEQARTALQRNEAELRSARFAVEVAEHQLQAAQAQLQYSAAEKTDEPLPAVPIRSPIDGVVLEVIRESEGVVQAGTPLLEVGNPNALEVAVDVLSADAVQITPGMPVLLERWGGPHPLEGMVKRVEPEGFLKISALGVEEQRVWVIVDITSPPEEWRALGDGYRVEARFILWHGDNVPQIPASALFRVNGGWAVMTVEGGRAEVREVTVGHRTGLEAEITEGLEEGEWVITHPDDRLEDGTRVRIEY
jgi:HlyD family secretion protein